MDIQTHFDPLGIIALPGCEKLAKQVNAYLVAWRAGRESQQAGYVEDTYLIDAELNRYDDEKYVRAAGNYLWLGVLMALDAVFNVREDRRTRVDIKDYREAVGRRDKKLPALVNDGYDVMHLYMNYDGNQSKGVSDEGFRLANNIIDRCAAMVN